MFIILSFLFIIMNSFFVFFVEERKLVSVFWVVFFVGWWKVLEIGFMVIMLLWVIMCVLGFVLMVMCLGVKMVNV